MEKQSVQSYLIRMNIYLRSFVRFFSCSKHKFLIKMTENSLTQVEISNAQMRISVLKDDLRSLIKRVTRSSPMVNELRPIYYKHVMVTGVVIKYIYISTNPDCLLDGCKYNSTNHFLIIASFSRVQTSVS